MKSRSHLKKRKNRDWLPALLLPCTWHTTSLDTSTVDNTTRTIEKITTATSRPLGSNMVDIVFFSLWQNFENFRSIAGLFLIQSKGRYVFKRWNRTWIDDIFKKTPRCEESKGHKSSERAAQCRRIPFLSFGKNQTLVGWWLELMCFQGFKTELWA